MSEAALRTLAQVAITGMPIADPGTVASERGAVCALPKPTLWAVTAPILADGRHFTALFAALRETGWLSLLPELEAAVDTPQDVRWHAEGPVGVHLALAAEAAAAASVGLATHERILAVGGALVHDLGKAVATQIRHEDGAVRITSRGHAEAGAPIAATLLERLGAPSEVVRPIATIVREHMSHVSGPPTARAARRLRRRLEAGGSTMQQWARVVAADSAGRGPSSRSSPATAWLAAAGEEE